MTTLPFRPCCGSVKLGLSPLVSRENAHRVWLVPFAQAKLTWVGSATTFGFWHATVISFFTCATLAGHVGVPRVPQQRRKHRRTVAAWRPDLPWCWRRFHVLIFGMSPVHARTLWQVTAAPFPAPRQPRGPCAAAWAAGPATALAGGPIAPDPHERLTVRHQDSAGAAPGRGVKDHHIAPPLMSAEASNTSTRVNEAGRLGRPNPAATVVVDSVFE